MRSFVVSLIVAAGASLLIGGFEANSAPQKPVYERIAQGPILGSGRRRSTSPGAKEKRASVADDAIEISNQLDAEPSFQTVGLTLSDDQGDCDPSCKEATVKYREKGASTWNDAVDMVYGPGGWEGVYRSSIVDLTPDTTYEVRVTLDGVTTHDQEFTTWAETDNWNIDQTITVAADPGTYTVSTSGTEGNYVLYDMTGTTITGGSRCVNIEASYVIVRGVTCNSQNDTPVYIKDGVTDVVFEDAEISNFSFPSTAGDANEPVIVFGENDGHNEIYRVVLQNNHIHSPDWGLPTDDWGSGLYGVMMREEHGGNHVFRHNTLVASNEHMWRDAFGGFFNNSEWGFGGENTNIYGNYISHCGDDCVEAEGGVANVKIFENYFTDYGVAVAVGGVARGPVYIFRNVVGEADGIALGDDKTRSGHVKTGTDDMSRCDPCGSDYGQHFVFHNTFVNIPGTENGSEPTAGNHWSLGPKGQHSKNNIYEVRSGHYALGDNSCFYDDQTNTFENDMYWPNESLNSCWEVSGLINSAPTFSQHTTSIDPGDDYFALLSDGTSGHDAGVVIPNFSDGYTGTAPDVGAMEHDQSAMCFGHTC